VKLCSLQILYVPTTVENFLARDEWFLVSLIVLKFDMSVTPKKFKNVFQRKFKVQRSKNHDTKSTFSENGLISKLLHDVSHLSYILQTSCLAKSLNLVKI